MLIKDLVAMIDTYRMLKERLNSLILKHDMYAPDLVEEKEVVEEIVVEVKRDVAAVPSKVGTSSTGKIKPSVELSECAVLATTVDQKDWNIDEGLNPTGIREKKEDIKILIQSIKDQINVLDTNLLLDTPK